MPVVHLSRLVLCHCLWLWNLLIPILWSLNWIGSNWSMVCQSSTQRFLDILVSCDAVATFWPTAVSLPDVGLVWPVPAKSCCGYVTVGLSHGDATVEMEVLWLR